MATYTYRTFNIFMALMTYVRQNVHINIFLNFVKHITVFFCIKVLNLKTFGRL